MKIQKEHYEYMKTAILSTSNAPTLADYLAGGATAKRWRWDLLWGSIPSSWICQNLYPYANNDHIDTALRKIVEEL